MQAAHFHSIAISDTQPDVRRDTIDTRQKVKHYVVTEQYQNHPESVNNCVLLIQQRHNTYYYDKDH
jgi:hypothetical protein